MATKTQKNLIILTIFLTIMGCVLLIGHSFKTLVLLDLSNENLLVEDYYESSNFQIDLYKYLEKNVYKRSLKNVDIQFEQTENNGTIQVSVAEQKNTHSIDKPKYETHVVKASVFQSEENEWNQTHRQVLIGLAILMISLITIIVLLVIISVFEKPREGALALGYDAIYSEIHVIFVSLPFLLWILFVDQYFYLYKLYQSTTLFHFIYYGLIVLFTFIVGQSYLSIVRNIKRERFFNNFLTVRITKQFFRLMQALFNTIQSLLLFEKDSFTMRIFKRSLYFTIGSFLMVLGFLMFFTILASPIAILFPILELIGIYLFLSGNNKVLQDADSAVEHAVEERVKSEKMKVELITNMSHDLKTPLTSIVSYVDLLSKEPLNEASKEYIEILTLKSIQLKNIVADLFDLSKGVSGNLTVNLETINIKKIIEQVLACIDEDIENRDLDFVVRLPETPLYVITDGSRMSRVFQNLFDNILKYALKNSRVYIELNSDDERVRVTFKNVSSHRINLTSDEILRRFSRGDASRHTEGSGLGLSICKSFTEACGGQFALNIDDDIFKVELSFKKAEKEFEALL